VWGEKHHAVTGRNIEKKEKKKALEQGKSHTPKRESTRCGGGGENVRNGEEERPPNKKRRAQGKGWIILRP